MSDPASKAGQGRARELEEQKFVRHLMYEQNLPRWRQYAAMVTGRDGVLALIGYELRVALFCSVPGALGIFLRQKFYRKLFRRAGRGLVVGRNVVIRHADKITLGDNVVLDDECLVDGRGAGEEGMSIGDNTLIGRRAIVQSKDGYLRLGANVNIGSDCAITSMGGLEIEDWAQIAGGCKISGGRFKLEPEMPDGQPFRRLTTGPVSVGKGCFLGPGVIVSDGASVGEFSVVGPGAVILANVPPYSVFMARPGMIMGTTKAAPSAE